MRRLEQNKNIKGKGVKSVATCDVECNGRKAPRDLRKLRDILREFIEQGIEQTEVGHGKRYACRLEMTVIPEAERLSGAGTPLVLK
jgi:hypothetical protein